MILDKKMCFCEKQAMTANTATTTQRGTGTDAVTALDWSLNGTDHTRTLTLFVMADKPTADSSVAVTWQTCDTNSTTASDWDDIATYPAVTAVESDVTFIVKDAVIPSQLKRFNRLKVTGSTAVNITAWVCDSQDAGLIL